MNKQKAVILLSGGLDSATVLAIAADMGFECFAITFRYGQRHHLEVGAAAKVAEALGAAQFRCMDLDLAAIGGSALTDMGIDVPKDSGQIGSGPVPPTYVPARNLIFLALAAAWAEVLGAFDIFIGVNCTDYSGYPDCRPEFISAFQVAANLATAAAVEGRGYFKVHAPLMDMTKTQIIQTGLRLRVDYSLTRSCYDPDQAGRSCGRCDSCRLRLRAFAGVGLKDPLEYQSPPAADEGKV